MPSKIVTPNLFRSFPSVRYATQAATKPNVTASLPKREPKLTTLPNGVIIASVENYSPVSRVSVSFKAGSRYEDGNNMGITHCIRNIAGSSTKGATTFGITKNVSQIGAGLTATTTREHLSYTLECNRDDAEFGLGYLSEVSSKQVFKPWEIKDLNPRMKLDLAVLKDKPHVIVLEQLHKAAFRNGLGNSLYSPSHFIGDHEPEMLKEFVKKHFTTNRTTVVGVGICHDYLVEYASKTLQLESGEGAPSTPTKYGGGEIRTETGHPLSYVAVATEGAGLKSPKDVLALALLQQIMGVGPNIKWSDGLAANKLAQVASKATDKPFAISALNVNYSDSGLFGFYCVAQPEEMGKVLKAVFAHYSSVTKNGVSDADVKIAKEKLKVMVAMALELPSQLLEEFSLQALNVGKLTNLDETFKAIDGVTANEVKTVSKRVINGKPSMAAVGALSHTPYIDQLI